MRDQEKTKIAVTPSGYDDIGAVLDSMGEGFAYDDITSDDLCELELLSRYAVVFINCSEECQGYAHEARGSLQRFVQRGGALYVSDWAGAYISEAFPEYITFSDEGGEKGTSVAEVTDPGLWEILGPSLELHFDLPGWKAIRHTNQNTRVYLRGSYVLEDGDRQENKPLLVSFDYGQGHVIYTAFHNEPQLSEKERQLLRFLVLKPVTVKVAKATVKLLATERLSAEKETVASIDPGGSSPVYSHVVPTGVNLKILLNWRGRETMLQLSVHSPDGGLYRQVHSNAPPLGVTVPNAQAGTWQYQVTGLAVPYANFPYVLTVATQPTATWSQPGLPDKTITDYLAQVCRHCGRSNRHRANFCAGCGQKL